MLRLNYKYSHLKTLGLGKAIERVAVYVSRKLEFRSR